MGISALYGMFAGYTTGFHVCLEECLNLGYIHFWVTAICAYGCFPMHFIGLAGLPRRYYTNTNFHYLMIYRMLMF
jgi:cytochrome c oxidase subunit 1